MKHVASLQYGVIFKKAFCDPEIFTAFASDFLNMQLEIDHVETEKSFAPSVGRVAVTFDLYAEDPKNRVIVDIQHERHADHYHRFLHYQCAALLEQAVRSYDYRPALNVFTLVVLTSGDKHKKDIAITDFDPKDLQGCSLGEIPHKIIYICPKYVNDETPQPYREWLLAIDDSLDEQIEESQYTRPEIRKIFDYIEKDLVTPEERAQMFAEHETEELGQEQYEAGQKKGRKEGERQKAEDTARNLLSMGALTPEQIARATGLTSERIQELSDLEK